MSPRAPHAKRGDRPARAGLGVLLGVLLAAAALPACKGLHSRNVPAFVLEIEARNRELEQEFARGNMLGVADAYTDDAVLVDAQGRRTTGRAEIDQYWSAIESPVEWQLEIESIRGSSAVAYELGRSHLVTRRDGALHVSRNDFLVVWRRGDDGVWRIELDAYWPEAEH